MVKPIYIAGEWRQGRGPVSTSYFPADGSINDQISTASVEDVAEAVEAAERAWRDPSWRHSLPHQRAAVLYRVADLIELRSEELARLQTRDNGKPLQETRGLVASAAGTARYFAAVCETLDEQLPTPRSPDFMTLSVHEPLGVVAAITPWNSPHRQRDAEDCPCSGGGQCGAAQAGRCHSAGGTGAGPYL